MANSTLDSEEELEVAGSGIETTPERNFDDEYIDEDFESEVEVSDEFHSTYLGEIKGITQQFIEYFFEGSTTLNVERADAYEGGPVPKRKLRDPTYVNQTLRLGGDITTAVVKAYRAMKRCDEIKKEAGDGPVAEDVALMLSALERCIRLRIPPCLRPGITLMYLEICQGVKF